MTKMYTIVNMVGYGEIWNVKSLVPGDHGARGTESANLLRPLVRP